MTSETALEVEIDEKIENLLKEPSKYNVIFMNDDATPMEWVVDLLMTIFKHTQSSSVDMAMEIHTNGSGVVGTYSYEIAEQKTLEATSLSRDNGFPLQIKLEAE